jgi:cytochrome c biogenesis protein CcdA
MHTILSYLAYIIIAIATTIWVGRVLYTRGRIFIVESFNGNEKLADSVNHLLIVGFYLINIGFVCLFLKFGKAPTNAIEAIEYISTKEGVVLIVLGVMHFFNIFNIAKMRKKALKSKQENVKETAVNT